MTSLAGASRFGTGEPGSAETGSRRDGDGRRRTPLSGVRQAPPLRHRSPGSDHRILRLRIPGILEDAARAGGVASAPPRTHRDLALPYLGTQPTRWFRGHDPKKWTEFRRRYFGELATH